jgi:hypothetical protein
MRMRHCIWALLFAALVAACGGPHEYALVGSSRAVGADGNIQVEQIEGGNRLVTISMQHLPPPDRLGDDMSVYAVWIVPPSGSPSYAGALEYDEDSREGRLMATTPHPEFTVKITAETAANAETPSEVVVAERTIEND